MTKNESVLSKNFTISTRDWKRSSTRRGSDGRTMFITNTSARNNSGKWRPSSFRRNSS